MFQKVIFTVGNHDFTGDEILAWAEARGELQGVRDKLRDALTCSLYAEEEGFKVDKAKVQAASEELRYKNQLKQAAETERWLRYYDLTVRDFTLYLVRHLWLDRFRPQLDALRPVYAPGTDSITAAFWPELIFGGHFRLLAKQLARRFALVQERQTPGSAGILPASAVTTIDSASGTSRQDACAPREMEQLYSEECAKVLTDGALERALRARRQDLIRVEFEEAVFPDEAMAQEALLCVREDGESFQEVAKRAGVTRQTHSAFLGQLAGEELNLLQSARSSQILGPARAPAGFRVIFVARKGDPDLHDAEIHALITEPLLNCFFAAIESRHVIWGEDR